MLKWVLARLDSGELLFAGRVVFGDGCVLLVSMQSPVQEPAHPNVEDGFVRDI